MATATAKKTAATATKKVAAAKKAPAKRPAAKKAPAKKAAPAKRAKKKFAALELKPIRDKLNRTQLVQHLVAETEVDKKSVAAVLQALVTTMKASLMPRGAGVFQVPGILTIKTRKVKAKTMPAIKKGTMVRQPGKADPVEHPGRKAFVKPATVRVRAVPMGSLKRAALGTE